MSAALHGSGLERTGGDLQGLRVGAAVLRGEVEGLPRQRDVLGGVEAVPRQVPLERHLSRDDFVGLRWIRQAAEQCDTLSALTVSVLFMMIL